MGRGIKIKVKCGCCKRFVFHTLWNDKWGFLINALVCKRCSDLLDNSSIFRQSLIDSRKRK